MKQRRESLVLQSSSDELRRSILWLIDWLITHYQSISLCEHDMFLFLTCEGEKFTDGRSTVVYKYSVTRESPV